MAIWASIPPDHDHSQIQPPAEVRSAESLGVLTWPEIDSKNPVFILRKKVSSSVGGIIHVADKGIVTKATAEKTGELRIEQEKREFLAKLIPTLKADSLIRQAIEKKTLQIHEVPGRNLYALSLDGRDVDMIFEKSGKEYFDFYWRRADMMRYAAFQGLSNDKFKEKVEWGRYKIIKEGKTLDPFSSESLIEYERWANHINILIRKMEEIQNRWDEMDKKAKK